LEATQTIVLLAERFSVAVFQTNSSECS